jgi:hypothetical protein
MGHVALLGGHLLCGSGCGEKRYRGGKADNRHCRPGLGSHRFPPSRRPNVEYYWGIIAQ